MMPRYDSAALYRFCRYYGKQPDSVKAGEREIPIDTDFRMGLLICALLADETTGELEKTRMLIRLYCGEIPTGVDCDDLAVALLSFYTMEEGRGPAGQADGVPVMDLLQDGPLVVAAFRQAYGIDLLSGSLKMHWWHFLMLLQGLPADTALMQTVRLWTVDADNIENDHIRHQLRRAKAAVALDGHPGTKTLEMKRRNPD